MATEYVLGLGWALWLGILPGWMTAHWLRPSPAIARSVAAERFAAGVAGRVAVCPGANAGLRLAGCSAGRKPPGKRSGVVVPRWVRERVPSGRSSSVVAMFLLGLAESRHQRPLAS